MKFSTIRIGIWIGIFSLLVFNGVSNESDDKNSTIDIHSSFEDKSQYISDLYDLLQINADSAYPLIVEFSSKIKSEEKTILINHRNVLATYYWNISRYDTAAVLYAQNIDTAEKYQLNDRLIKSMSNLGAILNVMGHNDSAYFYLKNCLPLAIDQADTATISKIRFDLGNYYKNKGYYHLALDQFLLAKEYYDRNQESVLIVYLYNSLGTLYTALKDSGKAKYYLHTAIKMDSARNDVSLFHDLFNNLGVCMWKLENEYDSARFYIQKSYEISLQYNSPSHQLVYLLNLGGLESDARNFDKSIYYLSKAEDIKNQVKNPYKLSGLYINIGTYHYNVNQFDKSREYLLKGAELAKTAYAYDNLYNAYMSLMRIDSALGDFSSALEYYKISRAFNDSLNNSDKRNKVAELEIIHETQQKEQQNTLLKKQNDLQSTVIETQKLVGYIIGLALLGLFVFSILLLMNRKKLKKARQLADSKNDKISKQNRLIENKKLILKQQKDELEELNQTKDKFFAIIAHDLKNPFSSLLGLLDILETDFHELEEDKKLEIIRSLANSGRNTYNMLVNLLDWARAQRGHIDPHIERLNLLKLVEASVLFLNQRISGKDHRVVHHIDEEIFVMADKNLLLTVIINILNNSVKFTKSGGSIEINAEASEEKVLLTLSDNGIGMNQNKLDDLFKITSKSSSRGTENEQGTGLGLILCKEFVQLINGAIWVESELGVGSKFYVEVPLATKTSQPISGLSDEALNN